ncbi:MAG: hypothetical protein JW754_02930 [Candidatus Aenigmarchaeota archaeon]|nr:hypothetical protein [Candidatus Aenigmarchaeota archaeon]
MKKNYLETAKRYLETLWEYRKLGLVVPVAAAGLECSRMIRAPTLTTGLKYEEKDPGVHILTQAEIDSLGIDPNAPPLNLDSLFSFLPYDSIIVPLDSLLKDMGIPAETDTTDTTYQDAEIIDI